MKFNYNRLKWKIRKEFRSQKEFANAIGINCVTLSRKLTNKNHWTQEQIYRACELLGIDLKDIYLYFFEK